MITMARKADQDVMGVLMAKLWPEHSPEGMAREAAALMEKTDAAFFLKWEEDKAVGFAQCQLRHDYVEGCRSSPVGYLEGIYVEETHRLRGIARELLNACENWVKEKGCREFASDCTLDNAQSHNFHMHAGFEEANRIICFVKRV